MIRRLWILPLAAMALSGCVDRGAQAQASQTKQIVTDARLKVSLATAIPKTIPDELVITGQMAAGDDVAVGSASMGRLISVYVKDGDAIAAGQTIAVVDQKAAQSALSQARSQVDAARAQLSQARKDAAAAPIRSSSAIRAAEARVRQAEETVSKLKKGARDQERAQAQASVDRADSDLKTAKAAMERARNLFREGAIAKSDLEQAENRYENALAGYRSALEAKSLVNDAIRPEDIRIAEQELAAAREQLRVERTNKTLDSTFEDRVDQARANLRSAEESVRLAQKAVADTYVKAPVSGRISGRPLEAGAVVAPGVAVARIIGGDGLYYEPELTEGQAAKVRPGMNVDVTVDALQGLKLTGTVASISPQATGVARLFRARVIVREAAGQLKAGMFARGRILLGEVDNVFVFPDAAVTRDGDDTSVWLAVGGKAVRKKVQLVGSERGMSKVKGLRAGDEVIVRGLSGLREGAELSVEAGE